MTCIASCPAHGTQYPWTQDCPECVKEARRLGMRIERYYSDIRPHLTAERQANPGQQWKCGDEFLPFHPQASHVPADYRDGWNRCFWMAVARGLSKDECADLVAAADYLQFDGSMTQEDAERRAELLRRIAGADTTRPEKDSP